MKIKFTLLTLLMCLAFNAGVFAQDTIRTLIITEVANNAQGQYLELTNVGSTDVFLPDFYVGMVHQWGPTFNTEIASKGNWPLPGWGSQITDSIYLAPGEQYIYAQVNDLREKLEQMGAPTNNTGLRSEQYLWDNADFEVHTSNYGAEYLYNGEVIPDSVSPNHFNFFTSWGGGNAHALYYNTKAGTAEEPAWWPVDGFKYRIEGVLHGSAEDKIVAGIVNATGGPWVFVRKSNLSEGNIDWDNARGTDLEDSEWIPIPMRTETGGYGTKYFTTIGNHGTGTIDAANISSTLYTIDHGNATITIPFGILKDSVMKAIDLGPNLAWHYDIAPSVADSVYNIVITDDVLTFYSVGEDLQEKEFSIIQGPAPASLNQVFPINRKEYNVDSEEYEWVTPYYVTHGEPVIDTIGDVLIGTRVDSLYKFVQKAPDASWEIDWVDDTERVDLKKGDILVVTAEDNSEKRYYIDVDTDILESDDAMLSAIIWPDAPDFLRLDPAWQGDTIPGFSSGKNVYTVRIPYGTERVPALRAFANDLNATLEIDDAMNTTGSTEERTTTITVTAADGETVNTYTILFEIERPEDKLQVFNPGPIITEVIPDQSNKCYWEISNPGNVPIDLSKYLFAKNIDDIVLPGEFITAWTDPGAYTQDGYDRKYFRYVPGYVFTDDTEEYFANGPILKEDLEVNPILMPGESFVVHARWTQGALETNRHCDVIFAVFPQLETERKTHYTEGVKVIQDIKFTPWNVGWSDPGDVFGIFEILNDSVTRGLKTVGDPNDYKLVDLFGDFTGDEYWEIGSDTVGPVSPAPKVNIIRKPEFWEGDTLPGVLGSWGTDNETSEWSVYDDVYYLENFDRTDELVTQENIGIHTFALFTHFISTISSEIYKVSDGFASPQTIDGVADATTVTDLLANIEKANEGQMLEVVGKSGDDVVAQGDVLKVTSADANNETEYTLNVNELSSDAVITSDAYTVEYTGGTGSISEIPVGTTLKEALENITTPANMFSMKIVDAEGNNVPLQMRKYDGEYFDIPVSSNIYIEVTAEDKTTTIAYQLLLDVDQSEVFIVSDQFEVNQVLLSLSGIPLQISVSTFRKSVFATSGGTYKVLNKGGDERTIGYMNSDDILVVTSADESSSKVYNLQFIGEAAGTEAFVTSNILSVDQIQMDISGEVESGVTGSGLLDMLIPADGATMQLKDDTGAEVTGELTSDGVYSVTVISGNGEAEAVYSVTISIITSAHYLSVDEIKVYPNPAGEFLYVQGVGLNSQIFVTDLYGKTLMIIRASDISNNMITISGLKSGLYLVKTVNEHGASNTIKFLKR